MKALKKDSTQTFPPRDHPGVDALGHPECAGVDVGTARH